MDYPYLGFKNDAEGRPHVVLFTSEDTGVVVADEQRNVETPFGYNGPIVEDEYDILPPEKCIRLQN